MEFKAGHIKHACQTCIYYGYISYFNLIAWSRSWGEEKKGLIKLNIENLINYQNYMKK
jgi:hypothetical protein